MTSSRGIETIAPSPTRSSDATLRADESDRADRAAGRSRLGAGRSPAPGELALAFTRIRNRAARAARTDTSGPTAHSGTAQKQRPRRRAAPDASAWANAGVSSSVARAGGGGPTRQSGSRRASACSSRLGRSARAAANVPRGRDTPPRAQSGTRLLREVDARIGLRVARVLLSRRKMRSSAAAPSRGQTASVGQ